MSKSPDDHVTVPTLISRTDGFGELAALCGAAVVVWWTGLEHWPLWAYVLASPFLIALTMEVMTGEAAADVQLVGAIASGLRSKLGLRRAHEWVAAWWHYTAVRTIPDFTEWSSTKWQNSRLRSKTQIVTRSSAWQRITSVSRISTRLRWSTPPWWPRHARPALAASPLSDVGHEPQRPN